MLIPCDSFDENHLIVTVDWVGCELTINQCGSKSSMSLSRETAKQLAERLLEFANGKENDL